MLRSFSARWSGVGGIFLVCLTCWREGLVFSEGSAMVDARGVKVLWGVTEEVWIRDEEEANRVRWMSKKRAKIFFSVGLCTVRCGCGNKLIGAFIQLRDL